MSFNNDFAKQLFHKLFFFFLHILCFLAGELVQKKVAEIQEKVKQGLPIDGEYLTHLLISEQMTPTEVLGSITELLLAGVDTVSSGIFFQYLLTL